MAYRLRYVILAGIGATFVLAHVAYVVSPWAPWAVPVVVAAICGAVVAEGNNGAGVGGLTAGGGGFLFVFSEMMDGPATAGMSLADALVKSTTTGTTMFAMFGLVGMLAGGLAGLSAAYARRTAGETDEEPDADDGANAEDLDDGAKSSGVDQSA